MPTWAGDLEHDRGHLWGLCYRLTGDAAESEDLVQETFARALAQPPVDKDRAMRPWLTRVATNLAIDALRRRQQQAYTGPWLPAPVRTQALLGLEVAPSASPDVEERYGVVESASIAFLVALEQLDPRERAVIILSDVVGHTSAEVAQILELGAANVRQILSRARKTLRSAGVGPARALAAADEVHGALERFLQALTSGDVDAIKQLLAEDVEFRSDSAGEFKSARNVLRGNETVVALLVGLTKLAPSPAWSSIVHANGLSAFAAQWDPGVGDERQAPRMLLRVGLSADGARISTIHLVLATRKLQAIEFGAGT